jgi:sugar O-acyltransferase (sialic acid O-acetyltransferase NeuD family)
MNQRCRLIIVGAGGFGSEVLWVASSLNAVRPAFDLVGFCDDNASRKGTDAFGHPVLGTPEEAEMVLDEKPSYVCALGNNAARAAMVSRLDALGWEPATVIHPSVILAPGAVVGPGTYIGAGSIVAPNARIGKHVIINLHCSIGHDAVLEDFVQVSPGGRISGNSRLLEGAMLASNAAVAPGRSIGRYATLGACSFALVDVPDGATAVGIPAMVAHRQRRPS